MIKLLDDLLIAATCCPTVPGSIVAGLREAVSLARRGDGNPAGTPGAKVDLSRLDALPHPFDGMEEAQRAAGIVPTAAASYRVCVRNCESGRLGEVMFIGNVPDSTYPPHADWLPCDKEGWVPPWVDKPIGLRVQETPFGWRPMPKPQFAFTTGHADAIPKPSALDEMAEQVRRWAVPLESTTASEIDPSAMLKPALAVQEGGSHYKSMKIQPVEYIHANGLGYFEGNVVKYVSRWRSKGGLQDLKKARHYLDLLIELEGGTK